MSMENNEAKHAWIESVLNSTEGIQHAQPSPGLYDQIYKKLNKKKAKIVKLPVVKWAAAAMLLLMINIGTIIYYTNRNKSRNIAEQVNQNPFTTELQMNNSYNY